MKKLLVFLTMVALMTSFAAAENIFVYKLEPNWDAVGGGGVYSAYYAPSSSSSPGVSPGITQTYEGRDAGIIKAGLTVSGDGHYWDEGLFGFKPTVTINQLAGGVLTYDVINQEGTNPVWMTIEIDTKIPENRSDNVVYQFVPTTNPSGWHTVDAGAGLWQKWNNDNGDVAGNPLITLGQVASENDGLNVVRAYLRLGMGDSYHGTGAGTVAWVDKATIGGNTYDFLSAESNQDVNGSLEDFHWSISVTPSVLQFGTIPRGSDITDEADNDPIVINTDGSETLSDKVYVTVDVIGTDFDFYDSLLEFWASDLDWTKITSLHVLEIPEHGSKNYYARLHGDTSDLVGGPKSATIVYTAYGEPLIG